MLSTGQSGVNLWRQYQDFNFPAERAIRLLDSESDLSSSSMALKWFARSALRSPGHLNKLLQEKCGLVPSDQDFWFVHGDTLSTLLGSIYAKRLGVRIVHIEAGMRSHDIFHPFPEEINRRIVSHLADFHMAPDENAKSNLLREGIEENVVATGGNTVLDALGVSLKRFQPKDLPPGEYAVANIHRFENLNSASRWEKIIDVIVQAARQIPIYLVMMPNTVEKLNSDPVAKRRLDEAKVTTLKRLPFSQFVHFMHNAKFMLTDGGSNQQECYHLGLPCLILREKTESIEGIGGCCVLSRLEDSVIQEFLSDPTKYRRAPPQIPQRPTDIIFRKLIGA